MARTDLTVTKQKVFDGTAGANEFEVVEGASDITNGNAFPYTGREILTLRNTSLTNARTLTVTSAPDRYGRVKDIATYSVPANKLHAVPPFIAEGWVQADGKIWVDGSNAELLLGVLKIPNQLPL